MGNTCPYSTIRSGEIRAVALPSENYYHTEINHVLSKVHVVENWYFVNHSFNISLSKEQFFFQSSNDVVAIHCSKDCMRELKNI